ncbi:MAG: hypothetical protein JWP10_450 [Nocardioidaceae bacterium]|nr:hypothetical protein [Nocardioidaceae bacterium]
MLAFDEHCTRQASLNDDKRVAALEVSFAADEMGLVLGFTARAVQNRMAQHRRLRELLPQTWMAWQRGEIDSYRASIIADHVAKLTDQSSVIRLDARVVERARVGTPAQLKSWLVKFVARAEPDATDARRKQAMADRRVTVVHDPDGVAWIHALVSTPDAARIDAALTRLAKQPGADDPRTLDQRRSDVCADLLLGRTDTDGLATISHASAVIGVTVPVLSLAGLSDAPGESLDGQFALSAEVVRELAAEPNTLFYRIFTDPLGHILDITETGRYPSRKLRTALEIRDGVCNFPTCSRPASESDMDHDVPHPRGPTSASNLGPLCRRHHRMKTHGVFETELATAVAGRPSPGDTQPIRGFGLSNGTVTRACRCSSKSERRASQVEYAFSHGLARGS